MCGCGCVCGFMFVLIIISVNCEVILAYNSGIDFYLRTDLISFQILSTSNFIFEFQPGMFEIKIPH